jgi:TRAP-type mannitol/chloroaromatic compound transport system permease small subunit
MSILLRISRTIDTVNAWFGRISDWFVLIAILISAGNAISRYLIGYSSNALLEIQWYLFGGMVLLGASYTLKMNEHVRVDVIYSQLSETGQLIVDIFGFIVFFLPAMAFLAWLSWPVFVTSFQSGETSNNYGGLIRWPIMLALPLGFTLLTLQGVSELIKRIAALLGRIKIDIHYEQPLQ